MNNLGRGPLDDATNQISKTWAFLIQTRRVFKFFSLYVSTVAVLFCLCIWFQIGPLLCSYLFPISPSPSFGAKNTFRQTIHMKCQALFSVKKKKSKCLLQL